MRTPGQIRELESNNLWYAIYNVYSMCKHSSLIPVHRSHAWNEGETAARCWHVLFVDNNNDVQTFVPKGRRCRQRLGRHHTHYDVADDRLGNCKRAHHQSMRIFVMRWPGWRMLTDEWRMFLSMHCERFGRFVFGTLQIQKPLPVEIHTSCRNSPPLPPHPIPTKFPRILNSAHVHTESIRLLICSLHTSQTNIRPTCLRRCVRVHVTPYACTTAHIHSPSTHHRTNETPTITGACFAENNRNSTKHRYSDADFRACFWLFAHAGMMARTNAHRHVDTASTRANAHTHTRTNTHQHTNNIPHTKTEHVLYECACSLMAYTEKDAYRFANAANQSLCERARAYTYASHCRHRHTRRAFI